MTTLAITDSGDLDLEGPGFYTGEDAIRSSVLLALRTLRGYYAGDLAAGIDGDLVFGSLLYLDEGESEIYRVGSAVKGVRTLEVRKVSEVGRTQTYSIKINASDPFLASIDSL